MVYLIIDLFNPLGNKAWTANGGEASLEFRQHASGLVTGEFQGVLPTAVNATETMESTHGVFTAKPFNEEP